MGVGLGNFFFFFKQFVVLTADSPTSFTASDTASSVSGG